MLPEDPWTRVIFPPPRLHKKNYLKRKNRAKYSWFSLSAFDDSGEFFNVVLIRIECFDESFMINIQPWSLAVLIDFRLLRRRRRSETIWDSFSSFVLPCISSSCSSDRTWTLPFNKSQNNVTAWLKVHHDQSDKNLEPTTWTGKFESKINWPTPKKFEK